MELEAAARKMLLADPTVAGYVGRKVYKHRLMEMLECGQRAIVLRRNGGWTQPDTITHQEYPLLQVQCWADVSRSPEGEAAKQDAEDNAWAVCRAVDDLMQGIRGQCWGELYIVGSSRYREGFVVAAEQHKLQDEAVYVQVEYAIVTFHAKAS